MRNHEKDICDIWENLSYVKNHGIYPIFFIMWDFLSYMGELILYFNNDRIFPPTWEIYSMVLFRPWDFSGILNEKSHHSPMEL